MKSVNKSTGDPLSGVAVVQRNKWYIYAVGMLFLLAITALAAKAQVKAEADLIKNVETFLKSFIKNNKYVKAAGPGLVTGKAGDILLELADPDESDFHNLVLLHKDENGNLTKIGENGSLMMTREILGHGFMAASLIDDSLGIEGALGSNSGYSEFSYAFKKGIDGVYYFKGYKMRTINYNIENFYNRLYFSEKQTGKMRFDDFTDNKLYAIEPKQIVSKPETGNADIQSFAKYAPKDYEVAKAAIGDLNLDGKQNDAVLYLRSTDNQVSKDGMIRVLVAKPGGGYTILGDNDRIVISKAELNTYNINIVVNNGYFTVEQREGLSETDDEFVQRQITFKFNSATKQLNLHRFQVEKFPEYGLKSQGFLYDLSAKDFGVVPFDRMQTAAFILPRKAKGVHIRYYDPSISKLTGTVQRKSEADSNYFVLIADTAFDVAADIEPSDPELQDHDAIGVKEVQVYTTDQNGRLADHVGAHVSLFGWLFTGRTAAQRTPRRDGSQ